MRATKERNATICDLYSSGQSVDEIHRFYGLSKQRIYQILHDHGVRRVRRDPDDRDDFLGVFLTETVKDALRSEAMLRNQSMSELTSEWISNRLTYCGYPVEGVQQ